MPSFSIGTSTPSAIRMADAYATFATSGVHVEPYSVTKVCTTATTYTDFQKPKRHQAGLRPHVANNVTSVLQDVVQHGTGTAAKTLGRARGGQDRYHRQPGGTRSAWFIGYTPQLSTSVVMFRQDTKRQELLPMSGTGGDIAIHGGDIPATIWTDYMKAALGDQPDPGFPKAAKIGTGPAPNEPGAPLADAVHDAAAADHSRRPTHPAPPTAPDRPPRPRSRRRPVARRRPDADRSAGGWIPNCNQTDPPATPAQPADDRRGPTGGPAGNGGGGTARSQDSS